MHRIERVFHFFSSTEWSLVRAKKVEIYALINILGTAVTIQVFASYRLVKSKI